jgi:hypothetical protein
VSDADQLRRLGIGFQVSQAIHVAARLGIADLLAGGARTSDELAEDTGTHADSLYRLLRALATVGVLHEEPGRRFALTPLGKPLRSDAEGSLAGWARFMGRPYFWEAWTALEHSVRAGENAFRTVHGTDVWSYRSEHPEESARDVRAPGGRERTQDEFGGSSRAPAWRSRGGGRPRQDSM